MTTGKAGAPSKYNQERHGMIVEASELGASMKDAAACGGIDITTLCRWMAEGKVSPDSKYRKLYHDVIHARGSGCRDALRQLKDLRSSTDERVKLEAVKFTVGAVHGYNKQRVEVNITGGVDEMSEVSDLVKLIEEGMAAATSLADAPAEDDDNDQADERKG